MNHRLPAALEAAAIRRLAESAGGFATILRSGDRDSGILLLVIYERGQYLSCVQRQLSATGHEWRECGPQDPDELAAYLERQRRFDADSWLIELDVPAGERFIVDLAAIG